MKKIFSLVLTVILCFSMPTRVSAADESTPENEVVISEYMGYNSDYGSGGIFYVNVPGSASAGQITVRIYSSDQTTPVWIRVTDPAGRVVWSRFNVADPNNCLYPENGAEQYSGTFSNAIDGNYKVEWAAIGYVTLNCWIYNW